MAGLDPVYYDSVNEDVLRRIPAEVRVVLDIGCAAGALGARLKAERPDIRVYGLETHPEAAATAATRLDGVLRADAEVAELADLGLAPGEPDCLIYADSLEHFRDPWAALARHVGWLAPGGHVVACIPNIQYWRVIASLVAGRFDYSDEGGILDRTHLRFFTLDSIRQLFRHAGLRITDLHGRALEGEDPAPFTQMLAPVARALGADPAAFTRQAAVYQWVVVGRRKG